MCLSLFLLTLPHLPTKALLLLIIMISLDHKDNKSNDFYVQNLTQNDKIIMTKICIVMITYDVLVMILMVVTIAISIKQHE